MKNLILVFLSLFFANDLSATDTITSDTSKSFSIEMAQKDIIKGNVKFLIWSGIASRHYDGDKPFEKKYNIKYFQFGCVLPPNISIADYNKVVANYLDDKYGTAWRKEVRKEPKNLLEKDINLFKHELNLLLPPVILVDFRNVSILRNFIFSLKTLKVHLSLTHVFSTSKKSILKRLLLFVLPAQKLEYGVWVTDELSAEYFHWFTDALTRLKAIEYGLSRTTINKDEIQLP
ncbi:MAG: hypothetical protein EOO43_24240, partial [Flavobacterium sp.]